MDGAGDRAGDDNLSTRALFVGHHASPIILHLTRCHYSE
jgi:hypothetical protein